MEKIINILRAIKWIFYDSWTFSRQDVEECYRDLFYLYRHKDRPNLTNEQYEFANKIIFLGGEKLLNTEEFNGYKEEYCKEWIRFLNKYGFVPGYNKAEEIYKAFKKEYFNDN